MSEMKNGTKVRFTNKFYSMLLVRQIRGNLRHGASLLDDIMRDGMTVQGEPRPGRINVVFMAQGRKQFRTYAAKDLVSL